MLELFLTECWERMAGVPYYYNLILSWLSLGNNFTSLALKAEASAWVMVDLLRSWPSIYFLVFLLSSVKVPSLALVALFFLFRLWAPRCEFCRFEFSESRSVIRLSGSTNESELETLTLSSQFDYFVPPFLCKGLMFIRGTFLFVSGYSGPLIFERSICRLLDAFDSYKLRLSSANSSISHKMGPSSSFLS